MAVCSYYCACCGVKLGFEEARWGRTHLESNSFYCPTCVIDHDIEVLEPPPSGEDPLVLRRLRRSRVGPIDIGSGEFGRVSQRLVRAHVSPATRSTRLAGTQGARGSARREAKSPGSRAAWPRRAMLVLGAVLAVALGALAFRPPATGRNDRPAPAVRSFELGAVPSSAAQHQQTVEGVGRAPVLERGDAQVHAQAAPFVASRKSGKVHRATCRYAHKIAEGNRVSFMSLERALLRNFVPCRVCFRGSNERSP